METRAYMCGQYGTKATCGPMTTGDRSSGPLKKAEVGSLSWSWPCLHKHPQPDPGSSGHYCQMRPWGRVSRLAEVGEDTGEVSLSQGRESLFRSSAGEPSSPALPRRQGGRRQGTNEQPHFIPQPANPPATRCRQLSGTPVTGASAAQWDFLQRRKCPFAPSNPAAASLPVTEHWKRG